MRRESPCVKGELVGVIDPPFTPPQYIEDTEDTEDTEEGVIEKTKKIETKWN
jgi:hypothetical protein